MILIQRRKAIKDILLRERTVKVSDLARKFDVSEETIRRDLTQLEDEGLVERNYGGAILVEELQAGMWAIPPVNQRKLHLFEEKDAIGKKAAELVEAGQIVIFDAGSTTWCIARYLQHLQDLTVVTNSLDVAESMGQHEGTSVFVLGGKLMRKSMSLVGPQAEVELRKYNADIAFMGTSGISLTKGFTSSDIYEAEIKRAMVSAAKKIVVVADHSKFSRQGLVSFATFDEVDALVTSEITDGAIRQEIQRLGVEVCTCPAAGGHMVRD
jgi:DeoR family transcriptional regulator of aga operon/DeoR family myo-inositol catabolism operon transcriptional repressor